MKQLPPVYLCVLMDILGYATFSVPILGEFADVLWAPFSAFIFTRMFGGRFGLFGGMLNFVEEILPFTDFIPSFTIAWFIKSASAKNSLRNKIAPATRH